MNVKQGSDVGLNLDAMRSHHPAHRVDERWKKDGQNEMKVLDQVGEKVCLIDDPLLGR